MERLLDTIRGVATVRPEDIVRHHDPNPDENPWVDGVPSPPEWVEVVAYDAGWPSLYRQLAEQIRLVLDNAALDIEHIGSTAVPGLAAKPVIDIDLTVADPTLEDGYVPALETLGYVLRIREPGWHQHRCLLLARPRVNLHVFAPGCPETIRHVLFRDWLRAHPEDRDLYGGAKQLSSNGARGVIEYNKRKEPVIRDIYARIFKAARLL